MKFSTDRFLEYVYVEKINELHVCCSIGPMVALFLIGLGTGGIKPCVCAFGGDQFTNDQVCVNFCPFLKGTICRLLRAILSQGNLQIAQGTICRLLT